VQGVVSGDKEVFVIEHFVEIFCEERDLRRWAILVDFWNVRVIDKGDSIFKGSKVEGG